MPVEIRDPVSRIQDQLSSHSVLLYMKGVPDFPQCGFSAQVVHILAKLNTEYAYVNVLENPDIRSTLPGYANWPTFPQLYIQGQLVGGCDIVTDMNLTGELERCLQAVEALKTHPPVLIEAG